MIYTYATNSTVHGELNINKVDECVRRVKGVDIELRRQWLHLHLQMLNCNTLHVENILLENRKMARLCHMGLPKVQNGTNM